MTLVELIVVMAILVTVTASTVLIFRGITKAWQTGELRTERYQQARLLLDLFSRELTTATISARYPFIGLDASSESSIHNDSVFDEIIFVGTLPGRGSLVERGYWVDAEGNLMCHDEEPADEDYSTGSSELCGHSINQLNVTYYDGLEWSDEWDGRPNAAQAGRLPKAVHIVITIGDRQPEDFETIIYIPTS